MYQTKSMFLIIVTHCSGKSPTYELQKIRHVHFDLADSSIRKVLFGVWWWPWHALWPVRKVSKTSTERHGSIATWPIRVFSCFWSTPSNLHEQVSVNGRRRLWSSKENRHHRKKRQSKTLKTYDMSVNATVIVTTNFLDTVSAIYMRRSCRCSLLYLFWIWTMDHKSSIWERSWNRPNCSERSSDPLSRIRIVCFQSFHIHDNQWFLVTRECDKTNVSFVFVLGQ